MEPKKPLVVSYGGGKNSTAMLIAMALKGIKPDAIVFSDTGNERGETYDFIERFDIWLKGVNFPEITTVRYSLKQRKKRQTLYPGISVAKNLSYWLLHNYWSVVAEHLVQNYRYENLGEEVIISHYLPAIAYGMGRCSSKWKITPVHNWRKKCFPGGGTVAIGYHSGEGRRLLDKQGNIRSTDEGDGWSRWYPLMDWKLDEGDCQNLCLAELGEIPPKSSCWFCPNNRPYMVLDLPDDIRQLGEDIEAMADYGAVARHKPQTGNNRLGRNFSWREVDALPEYRKAEPPKPCSCWDDGMQLEFDLDLD